MFQSSSIRIDVQCGWSLTEQQKILLAVGVSISALEFGIFTFSAEDDKLAWIALLNKGLFTLDTQCALNQIESGLSVFALNAHSPNPDRIRISPNPLPEMVSIWIELDRAIVPCTWGPKRAWHACSCRLPTVSALLRATHCVPRICSTREAIWWLAEVKIWRGCHGSCVEVWSTCTREFGSAQCSVDANHAIDAYWIRIEFALGNSVTEPVWIRIQCEQAFTFDYPDLRVFSMNFYKIIHGNCVMWCVIKQILLIISWCWRSIHGIDNARSTKVVVCIHWTGLDQLIDWTRPIDRLD